MLLSHDSTIAAGKIPTVHRHSFQQNRSPVAVGAVDKRWRVLERRDRCEKRPASLIPSHVMSLALAQEHGFTYMKP